MGSPKISVPKLPPPPPEPPPEPVRGAKAIRKARGLRERGSSNRGAEVLRSRLLLGLGIQGPELK
jgi:hypothetical protein